MLAKTLFHLLALASVSVSAYEIAESLNQENLCCPPGYTGHRSYNKCHEFYHCVNGNVYSLVQSCGPGTLFNTQSQGCAEPNSFTCVEDTCDSPQSLSSPHIPSRILSSNNIIPVPNSNNVFYYDSTPRSWNGCRTYGQSHGYELASILSPADTNILTPFINQNTWIGGFQQTTNAPWEWTDGSTFSYTNWNANEPNNSNNEDHIEMYSSGVWNDRDDNVARPCLFKLIANPPTPNPTLNPTSAPTSTPTLNPTPAPTSNPTVSPTPAPTTSNPTISPTFVPIPLIPTFVPTGAVPSQVPSSIPFPAPTPSASLSSPGSPTTSPTTSLTPWLVGPTAASLNGGNNYFDGQLDVTNEIGSKVTRNVVVELFDHLCKNKRSSMNTTNAVTIFEVNPNPATFSYSINISQSNIGDDTGGFVFSTGPSTGDVKFCTRVSTWEGSIQIAFRETNFLLRYDLTENFFNISDITISENDPDSFITDVDTEFSVKACQCINYVCTTAYSIQQDENLVLCLEPEHPFGMAHVVHISNFNLKIFSGSSSDNDYVEYNPVWFSTGSWNHDSLTDVSEQPDPGDVIMISTPVIAQFFIKSHTSLSVVGNAFLEFDATKGEKAPMFNNFNMDFGIIVANDEGCFKKLTKKVRGFFKA